MNRLRIAIVSVAVIMMLLVVSVVAQSSRPTSSAKWEYKAKVGYDWTGTQDGSDKENHFSKLDDYMNASAREGWEVISVTSFSLPSSRAGDPIAKVYVVMKRPKP